MKQRGHVQMTSAQSVIDKGSGLKNAKIFPEVECGCPPRGKLKI